MKLELSRPLNKLDLFFFIHSFIVLNAVKLKIDKLKTDIVEYFEYFCHWKIEKEPRPKHKSTTMIFIRTANGYDAKEGEKSIYSY